jgi:class 3 adenylate cyclase
MMGSEAHIINYTIFGREVNLASRLEGVSGRSRIIIGEATLRDLEKYEPELGRACVELPPVKVKGIASEVRIWEVPWKNYLPPSPPAAATTQPA